MNFTPQDIDRAIMDVQKAISEVPVSGLLLVREDLQDELVLMAPTDTPLRNRLNRKKGSGKAHAWYKLVPTATESGYFIGTAPQNGFFERGGLPNATDASYRYVSAPYCSLGDLVTVSLFDQMAGATYADIKQQQIKVKMINVALMEEWAIINGDSSYGAGLQFDGLRKLINGVEWDNVIDNGGQALSLEVLRNACRRIYDKGGKPQAVVLSLRDKQRFNQLIFNYWGLKQMGAGALGAVSAGFDVKAFDFGFGSCDIIQSRYLRPGYNGMCDALVIDDKTVLDDGNAIQMVDLMPISAIDLALIQSAYRTLIAEFTVLQMTSEAFQCKIINIKDNL